MSNNDPDQPGLNLLPDTAQSVMPSANSAPKDSQDSRDRAWTIKQAEYLVGQFKNDGTYDGKMYAAALVELFMGYARPVIFKATDVRLGLASKFTFMPAIAEVREFLDELAKPTVEDRSAAFQAQREQWAKEDAELAARKANDKKWGPEEWTKHRDFLARLSQDRLVGQIGQEAFDALPDYNPEHRHALPEKSDSRASEEVAADLPGTPEPPPFEDVPFEAYADNLSREREDDVLL